MGLYVPSGSDFKWQLSSIDGVRPAAAMGATITPSTTQMGSWTEIITGAQMINDAYGILINFNSASASAIIRNYLVDIGIDNAGGTNYIVKIPYLIAGHASPYTLGSGGVWYYFPLYIPAGSSIAMRAIGSSTSTFRGFVNLYGQPRRPDSVRVGSKVFAFGAQQSLKYGTVITLGTTAKSSWSLIDTTTMPLWWWQVGYTSSDTTTTGAALHLDVGAGDGVAEPKILIQDNPIVVSSTEYISNSPLTAGCSSNVATGSNIYARGWSSAAPDTNTSVVVYGLGG